MRQRIDVRIGAVALLVIAVLARIVGADGTTIDLSTPEATIATYYRGYNLGDRNIIAATFLKPGAISSTGLGVATQYRIVSKKIIVHSPVAQPGDLEIETVGEDKWPDGRVYGFITSFFLRQVGGEWKIAGYASEPFEESSLPHD